MSVDDALAHLSDQLRFATCELTPRGPRAPLTWRFFQWFGIVVMPWPHGWVRTSPELLQTPADKDFEAGRGELARLIDRFAATPDDALGAHPMFGSLSPDLWGILAWRHLDYHLRQFGVASAR